MVNYRTRTSEPTGVYENFYQSQEASLRSDRAVQMVVHAYRYVRGIDPDGESGAADLLRSTYEELKRN